MAFDIGQRVTSSFTGPGTVTGELTKESDTGDNGKVVISHFQTVKFDNPVFGERRWELKKLFPINTEEKAKKVSIAKSKSQLDYEAAAREGLTHFQTVEDFKRDEPKLDIAEYQWLKTELQNRGYRIRVYATEKNAVAVAKQLGDVLGIASEVAYRFLTVRPRTGGSKWNLDFVNFPALTDAVRDRLEVNFSHYKGGDMPDIRHVRCGCTKLVQQMLKDGFAVQIPEGGGDVK
jgi:hypothetical protein